jgi:hypothetical protein
VRKSSTRAIGRHEERSTGRNFGIAINISNVQAEVIKVLTLALESFENVRAAIGITDTLEEVLFCNLNVVIGCAEGFEESEYLLPILDALLGVDEGYLSTVGLVGCEERRPAPFLVDGGELVGDVVDVC